MIILLDFDGTLFFHKYPIIGEEIPYAFEYCRKFQQLGCKLILWTMRSGHLLDEAVKVCEIRGLKFFGINENPTQKSWTSSPKPDGQLVIDDRNYGTPLVHSLDGERDYCDWSKIGPGVLKMLEL